MTLEQKRIVGILAIANVVVILILVALMTRPSPPPHPPPPTPTRSHTLAQSDCQWQATQLLAQAGLGGTVTRTADRSLDFEANYPLAPDESADDAAQFVWTAFDIALTLQERRCPRFPQVQVTILAHSSQINAQIYASVSITDLIAFDTGELGEDAFIERVTYTHSITRDE